MSRRADREGVPRHELQARRNAEVASRYERCLDARGWYRPSAPWEGFDELNVATGWTRRLLILLRHVSGYEREYHLRHARAHLADACRCAAPKLP